jgi:hypothetical protein
MARAQEIKHHTSEWSKYPESNLYSLTIVHHNVQSLTNKLMELSAFLNPSLLDILYFSEHWLIKKQKP